MDRLKLAMAFLLPLLVTGMVLAAPSGQHRIIGESITGNVVAVDRQANDGETTLQWSGPLPPDVMDKRIRNGRLVAKNPVVNPGRRLSIQNRICRNDAVIRAATLRGWTALRNQRQAQNVKLLSLLGGH